VVAGVAHFYFSFLVRRLFLLTEATMDKLKKTLRGDDDEEQGIVSQVTIARFR